MKFHGGSIPGESVPAEETIMRHLHTFELLRGCKRHFAWI